MFFIRFWRRRMTPVLLVIVLFGAGLAPGTALAQGPPTVDSILQDWKQRQEQFQTLSFTWTAQTTYPRGTLPGGTTPVGHGPMVTPPEDVTQAEQMALKIKGDWMYYLRDGPQWVPDADKFLRKRYESSFDGSDSKDFYEGSKDDSTVHHLGFVNPDDKSQDVTNYAVWPILFHYRPVHRTMGRFASARWEIIQTGVTLRGGDCALLKNTVPGDMEETCWVDTGRRFLDPPSCDEGA